MDRDIAKIWEELILEEGGVIVLVVIDGVGGLPDPEHGGTELEVAHTPNLDQLARESSCGLLELVGPGITPGSGPGHLALFGDDHSLYFLHVKKPDSTGEDRDFDRKVQAIEAVDGLMPVVMDLSLDVLVVTADHSTPALMGDHSWHPVPVMIRSKAARGDEVDAFDEYACLRGALGLRPGIHLMGLALAHAGRLAKYGA